MKRNKKIPFLRLPAAKPIIDTEIVCNHKWKDFKWYYDATYNYSSNALTCTIYEPYVCIYCKQRKDVKLEEWTKAKISFEDAQKEVEKIKEKYYDYLGPKALIEDEINDFIMVDRDFLKIYDKTNAAITENQLLLLEK